MRFALLGDHPDGLHFARAAATSGRHELGVYSGSVLGLEWLRRWGINPPFVGDLEEILADPAIEAVIVAGKPADRPAQLRRALQSERPALCVHPADDSPDLAYEAAMIQTDTRTTLLPLLPEALHPGVRRLATLVQSVPNKYRLIEMERAATDHVLLETETPGHGLGIPGWNVLRLLGGEIVEIVGLTASEEVEADAPVLLAGRFERGGLFQMTLLPDQPDARLRWSVRTGVDRLDLLFDEGWPGPARLTWRDERGNIHEEAWESWDPWAALVEAVDAGTAPRWQDEVRCLELDDAARRSVERRRASTLEYQEVTEEAGFKGTMTLVGCSLVWGSLVLLLVSPWVPWLAWFILPMFGVFLGLQLLRWIVPAKPEEPPKPGPPGGS
jgi:predicted dehydrogenase